MKTKIKTNLLQCCRSFGANDKPVSQSDIVENHSNNSFINFEISNLSQSIEIIPNNSKTSKNYMEIDEEQSKLDTLNSLTEINNIFDFNQILLEKCYFNPLISKSFLDFKNQLKSRPKEYKLKMYPIEIHHAKDDYATVIINQFKHKLYKGMLQHPLTNFHGILIKQFILSVPIKVFNKKYMNINYEYLVSFSSPKLLKFARKPPEKNSVIKSHSSNKRNNTNELIKINRNPEIILNKCYNLVQTNDNQTQKAVRINGYKQFLMRWKHRKQRQININEISTSCYTNISSDNDKLFYQISQIITMEIIRQTIEIFNTLLNNKFNRSVKNKHQNSLCINFDNFNNKYCSLNNSKSTILDVQSEKMFSFN